jgi:uncharacterized protein YndB with AHSA1/START domain
VFDGKDSIMDGQLEQAGTRWVLRFTRTLRHPPEKVWRALTENAELEAWFPTTIDGERTAGAALTFRFREGELPDMRGEMLACDPPRLLELSWGGDVLRFELRPDGDGTVLTLTDTFDEVGKASRDAAGWHVKLEELAYHLDGEQPPWEEGKRWAPVHEGYVEQFGPEASTVGPPS